MAGELHEYAFDIILKTSFRVNAASLQAAKDMLVEQLDCATINCGETDDGQMLVAEATIKGDPGLFEFDGEPAQEVDGEIQIGD